MLIKPLPYEVNFDKEKEIIEALVNEPVDPKAPLFGTYDEAKARIELQINLPHAVNKGKRKISKLKTASTPLTDTEGKGEDEEESKKEEEPVKKKGKVIITKPPNLSTAVFTRRSRKKGSEVVFSKPPPTFQERLK